MSFTLASAYFVQFRELGGQLLLDGHGAVIQLGLGQIGREGAELLGVEALFRVRPGHALGTLGELRSARRKAGARHRCGGGGGQLGRVVLEGEHDLRRARCSAHGEAFAQEGHASLDIAPGRA